MNASNIKENYLCIDCIQALWSRGEKVFQSNYYIDEAEAEEQDIVCEFCGERADTLHEVIW